LIKAAKLNIPRGYSMGFPRGDITGNLPPPWNNVISTEIFFNVLIVIMIPT
jgi:hypothetical protein